MKGRGIQVNKPDHRQDIGGRSGGILGVDVGFDCSFLPGKPARLWQWEAHEIYDARHRTHDSRMNGIKDFVNNFRHMVLFC